MSRRIRQITGGLLWLLIISTVATAQTKSGATMSADDYAVQSVEAIHGTAGPFAVAGYRMGRRALDELGLLKGSFALDVQHEAPAEVQWSCIVDGLQAATGASLGKLNLHMSVVRDQNAVRSYVVNRENGGKILFRLQDSFLKRFLNVPVKDLSAAGRVAQSLSDDEIFSLEVVASPTAPASPFKRRAAQTALPSQRR